jgi:protein TonB
MLDSLEAVPDISRSPSSQENPDQPDLPGGLSTAKWSPFEIFGTLLTTSACVHILLVGFSGFGIHADPVRSKKVEPPATKIVEDVNLEPAPPPPKEEAPPPPAAQTDLSAPTLAADIDLPPLPEVAEISAVAANVPVAFSIAVNGPVRIVKDAAHASGAVGGRRSVGPVSVDAGQENARFLLLPPLSYPTLALERRISGTVEIEFKTTPTGDIIEIKVRTSSGYADLDRAALQNMRRGRWTGSAGFFVKNFVFVLR